MSNATVTEVVKFKLCVVDVDTKIVTRYHVEAEFDNQAVAIVALMNLFRTGVRCWIEPFYGCYPPHDPRYYRDVDQQVGGI